MSKTNQEIIEIIKNRKKVRPEIKEAAIWVANRLPEGSIIDFITDQIGQVYFDLENVTNIVFSEGYGDVEILPSWEFRRDKHKLPKWVFDEYLDTDDIDSEINVPILRTSGRSVFSRVDSKLVGLDAKIIEIFGGFKNILNKKQEELYHAAEDNYHSLGSLKTHYFHNFTDKEPIVLTSANKGKTLGYMEYDYQFKLENKTKEEIEKFVKESQFEDYEKEIPAVIAALDILSEDESFSHYIASCYSLNGNEFHFKDGRIEALEEYHGSYYLVPGDFSGISEKWDKADNIIFLDDDVDKVIKDGKLLVKYFVGNDLIEEVKEAAKYYPGLIENNIVTLNPIKVNQ